MVRGIVLIASRATLDAFLTFHTRGSDLIGQSVATGSQELTSA